MIENRDERPSDPEPNPSIWETARSGLGFGSLATVGSTPTSQINKKGPKGWRKPPKGV